MSNILKKRIKVTVPARNESGFGFHSTKKTHVVGQCEFFGINEVFGVLQVTVDRTPIFPVLESQIEAIE